MLEDFYTYPYVLRRLRGSSLGDIVDDMAAYLHARGHAPKVAQAYLRGAGHFAHWLDRERISPHAVTETTLASFMDAHLPSLTSPVGHREINFSGPARREHEGYGPGRSRIGV